MTLKDKAAMVVKIFRNLAEAEQIQIARTAVHEHETVVIKIRKAIKNESEKGPANTDLKRMQTFL